MSEQLSKFETKRRFIQNELETLLGSSNVYFQPPENIKLKYPAIVYSTGSPSITYANNKVYSYLTNFVMTYIRKTSGDDLPETIVRHFQNCTEDRTFVSDNLYHTVFKLFI